MALRCLSRVCTASSVSRSPSIPSLVRSLSTSSAPPSSSSPPPIALTRIDHLVLTVRSIPATCAFYSTHFNLVPSTFGPQQRTQLSFGPHKFNLHQLGSEFDPKAIHPTPGSADLCLITEVEVEEVKRRLEAGGVQVVEGVVTRTGAMGPIRSVYCRDPDGNLLEISNYDTTDR